MKTSRPLFRVKQKNRLIGIYSTINSIHYWGPLSLVGVFRAPSLSVVNICEGAGRHQPESPGTWPLYHPSSSKYHPRPQDANCRINLRWFWLMAAARRAFRVENHLRINNHNNLFYGRCRISAILRYYSPTKFLSIYCGLVFDYGNGQGTNCCNGHHPGPSPITARLVVDSHWEIPLFFWHLTKVTHDPQSVTPRHPKV